MTTDESNVVRFTPRPPPEPPPLTHVDIHINEDGSFLLVVLDEAGDCYSTEAPRPPGLDNERLQAAASRWRGTSAAVS